MPLRAFLLLAAGFAPGLALAAEGPGLLTDNGSSLVLATASLALLHALLQHRRIRAAEARARFFAHHEPLTGLLNRPHFLEALEKALASRREDQALTALSIDLDGLREINDLHGPEVGDAAIVQFSNALVRLAGPGALVGRFGGDKFAVALWSRPGSAALRELATGILKAAEGPFAAGGTSVRMEAQIGIATAPGDADTAARLLKAAGLALDRARLRGGSGYEVFERTLETELQQRRDLEKQIRETLAEGAFDLHFQPLFDTDQTRLTGFEALLRMPNRRGGFVSPAVFIPIAEEIGLITEIGDWVLRRACALAAHWPDHLCVAVNLSPAQFGTGAVCRTVRQALQEAGLPPHRLELEITEGLVLNDDAGIRRELTELKELGVSIVMDDFGTGYSSLSYLWKFPFDKIKIDRSFMGALGVEDRQVTDVIQAILSLSRSLHMRVTAEGVETREQAAFLKTIGCDEVQGFYFGRPMPVDEVALAILRDVQAEIRTDTADPLRRAG